MPRFDLKEELRATVRAAEMRGEGVAGIAARLAMMLPSLPQDTVEAVISQLFRAEAACLREQLADRAVATLLDMYLGDGGAHALTSFEPRSVCGHGGHPPAVPCAAAASSRGPLSELALRGHTDGVGEGAPHSPRSGSAPDASDETVVLDMAVDAELTQLLALGDEDIGSCARTLLGILDRIAAEPTDAKVRRLRLANPKFAAAVGRHPPALALLRLAGFADDAGEGDADAGLAFVGDPVTCAGFARVRVALRGMAEACSAPRGAGPGMSIRVAPAPAGDFQRRAYVADLTERRLRDPRGFRAEAEAGGAANPGVGGYPRKTAASAAAPYRRVQNFTLSDIDRLRVSDEIASMPNYAEEYHDCGSLVARGLSSTSCSSAPRMQRGPTRSRSPWGRQWRSCVNWARTWTRGLSSTSCSSVPRMQRGPTRSRSPCGRHWRSCAKRARIWTRGPSSTSCSSTPSMQRGPTRSRSPCGRHRRSCVKRARTWTRGYDPELIGRQALDATNLYRASKNLTPLRWHDGIAQIALEHAEQMASGAVSFSHDGFYARLRAFPVAYRAAAENLALNQGVSDVAGAAVFGWIKSPGHEKNLRGAFNVCGIGVARAADGTFYLTQIFAAAL